jgi:CheY-like chemotaxis protein
MAEILVIDDHAGDRYIMAEALAGAGHKIRQAKNGAEGLALCRERLPSLVITDIVMAGTDGIETIRGVRQMAPNLPILAVSGAEHSAFYLNAVTLLGADAVLAKPFTFDELLGTVTRLLPSRRSRLKSKTSVKYHSRQT